jgi:organic hydroperoxide reductase OsmC/OhrA
MKFQVRGVVPGIDQAAFAAAAEGAKKGCPVSVAFEGNIQMELEARLES